MPSAEKESLIRVNCAGVPFSARSPPRRQNSAVGALAFIWRTTSSNHGRHASSKACRSFTAMNVKSLWAGASAPRKRPGQTPSDNNAPPDRRSHWRRVSAAGMNKRYSVSRRTPLNVNFSGTRMIVARPRLSPCLDGLELLNVVGWQVPLFGAFDDEVFVIAIGQGRIGLGMAAIECNEKRPFRITLAP